MNDILLCFQQNGKRIPNFFYGVIDWKWGVGEAPAVLPRGCKPEGTRRDRHPWSNRPQERRADRTRGAATRDLTRRGGVRTLPRAGGRFGCFAFLSMVGFRPEHTEIT